TKIAEPDGAFRMHQQVIRRVELLVMKMIHQHGDRAVVFGSGDPAHVVFAGDQPTLSVPTVAIAIVRRAAENADLSGFFEPSENSIVGNVAEEQIPPIPKPNRPFRPTRACVKALNGSVAD